MSADKLRIVLPDAKNVTFGELDLNIFEKYGEVVTYQISKTEQLTERLENADVILCNKTILNRKTLSKAPNLKYIGLFATGYNNVDMEYIHEKGITVCNAGSYSTESVVQHVFALLLNHMNKISEYKSFVDSGGWLTSETFSPFIYKMQELNGKTIAIIGFGSIGKRVADIALAFGMKVLAYSRDLDKVEKTIKKEYSIYYEKGMIQSGEIDTLVSESDIVTLHCPLNKESEKMISKKLLAKFKTGAYLINTSRGGVIDEKALAEAVKSGKLSGAAIDVIDKEPMDKDCELFGIPEITITPHVAWAPFETRKRLLSIVEDNLNNFINGNPTNVVS